MRYMASRGGIVEALPREAVREGDGDPALSRLESESRAANRIPELLFVVELRPPVDVEPVFNFIVI